MIGKKVRLRYAAVYLAVCLCIPQRSYADAINLKNGRSIVGLIKREDARSFVVEVGFGTIEVLRNEIASITTSTPEEIDALRKKWAEQKKSLEVKSSYAEEQRAAAVAAWQEQNAKATQERIAQAARTKEVRVSKKGDHFVVDALLNDKVSASFFLDTGASFIVITGKVAGALGAQEASIKEKMTVIMADGRKVEGKQFLLKKVKIQDVEAKDVQAVIITDEHQGSGFGDGLLGMSFLSRFNFKIDQECNKLVLEEIDPHPK